MKIRQGFVSNSSSSSFVCVVEEGVFDVAVSMLKDERDKKIIKAIVKKEKKFDKNVLTIMEYNDTGGYSNIFGEGDDFDCEAAGITEEECEIPIIEEYEGKKYEETWYPSNALHNFQEVLEELSEKKELKGNILIVEDING